MGSEIEIKYKRDVNGNYIILAKTREDSYQDRMLLNNKIPYLMETGIRHMNGVSEYYYRIPSGLSLKQLAETRDLSFSDIRLLFDCINCLFKELEEHLLKAEGVYMHPECIVMGKEKYCFCYYPELADMTNNSFETLSEFLIDKVDKKDQDAIELAYGYYQLAGEGNVNPKELLDKKQKSFAGELRLPEVLPENPYSADESESYYYKEAEEKEETKGDSPVVPMTISFLLILLSGGIYIYAFLNPWILSYLGIAQQDYIVAGALLAGITVLLILLVLELYMLKKKRRENNEAKQEKEQNEAVMPQISTQEWEEYRGRKEADAYEGEETVLLSAAIRESVPVLLGSIKGLPIRISINEDVFTIGKNASMVQACINDPSVSRVHAQIVKREDRYYIKDMNSRNGISHNGTMINPGEERALFSGDRIIMGDVELAFIESFSAM